MSRRRNSRKHEPSMIGPNRDLEREHQVLNAKTKDVDSRLSKILGLMPEATESEALEIALILQRSIRGKASLLERPDAQPIVSALREQAAARDDAVKRFEQDKQGFIDNVMSQAERNMPSEAEREKLRAKALQELNMATLSARARNSANKKKFEQYVNGMPKRQIHVLGHVEMVKVGDGFQPKVFPEEIRIKHMIWSLEPGTHLVPEIVAQVFDNRQRGAAETAARQKVLQASGEAGRDVNVFTEWQKINEEYGSATEMPQAVGLM